MKNIVCVGRFFKCRIYECETCQGTVYKIECWIKVGRFKLMELGRIYLTVPSPTGNDNN